MVWVRLTNANKRKWNTNPTHNSRDVLTHPDSNNLASEGICLWTPTHLMCCYKLGNAFPWYFYFCISFNVTFFVVKTIGCNFIFENTGHCEFLIPFNYTGSVLFHFYRAWWNLQMWVNHNHFFLYPISSNNYAICRNKWAVCCIEYARKIKPIRHLHRLSCHLQESVPLRQIILLYCVVCCIDDLRRQACNTWCITYDSWHLEQFSCVCLKQ